MTQSAYLTALAITLVCEAPVVAFGYRRVRPLTLAAGFVAVNLLTHGLLWVARPSTTGRVMAAEAMIALVEAGLYARLFGGGARRALIVSVAANGLSLAVGLLLMR
jgi:hypothetical protein